MEENSTKIGDVVTYTDETGVVHPSAVVTAVHGPECINVVYVSEDTTKTDSYGRQIERATSVQLKSGVTAKYGRFYTV